MTFRVLDALPVLVLAFGPTINKVPSGERSGLENQKAMGFQSSSAKVMALDVYPGNLDRVRLWIEPPAPPSFIGVTVLGEKKCADLRRPELMRLADGKGIYIEVETREALDRLLGWYA